LHQHLLAAGTSKRSKAAGRAAEALGVGAWLSIQTVYQLPTPQSLIECITYTLNWGCRLEEAYEAEVARQGGLHSARPKALLDALQPEFPELTLQIIK